MPWFGKKDRTDYREIIKTEREKTREKKTAVLSKVIEAERLQDLMITMLTERARDA